MSWFTLGGMMKVRGIRKAGALMNAMLVFIPLAIVGHLYDLGPVFIFSSAALSCIPLSYRLGQATEALGARLGSVTGGLLNATFGNAAELIISIAALSQGLFIIVRTTLIGSILGQLLLVLGTSLLVSGIKYRKSSFSPTLMQIYFTIMIIALVVIALPSVVLATVPEKAQAGLGFLIPVLYVFLIYGFAVFFSLRRCRREGGRQSSRSL